MSANIAYQYGQVNMKFETTEGEYENPDRSDQWADTMTTATKYQSYETTTAVMQ